MLSMFFLLCAVVGGSLVVAQLLLSAAAFGAGHGLHFHATHGGGGGAAVGHHGGAGRGLHRGGARGVRAAGKASLKAGTAPGAPAGHWAFAWLQSIFNFQGIVAGATVLGLAGLAAMAAKLPGFVAVLIGIGAALVMMLLVEALFGLMLRMDNDGTVQIEQAVGQVGTVYLGIPPKNGGCGKILVTLQQREMEFPAATGQDQPLPTGQKVIVVAVREGPVMEVVSAEKYLHDIQTLENQS